MSNDYSSFNSTTVDNASAYEASNYKALLAGIVDIPRSPTVSKLVDPKEYSRQYFLLHREKILAKGRERYRENEEVRDIIAKRAQLRYLIEFFKKYYNDPNYDPRSDLFPRRGKLRGMSVIDLCKAAGCSYNTLAKFYTYGWIPATHKTVLFTDKHIALLKELLKATRQVREPLVFKKGIILKPLIDKIHKHWK